MILIGLLVTGLIPRVPVGIVDSGYSIVSCQIDGRPAKALLDTGSFATLVNPDWVARNLRHRRRHVLRFGGKSFSIAMRYNEMYPFRDPNSPLGGRVDLVLGMDVLKGTILRIDYGRQTVECVARHEADREEAAMPLHANMTPVSDYWFAIGSSPRAIVDTGCTVFGWSQKEPSDCLIGQADVGSVSGYHAEPRYLLPIWQSPLGAIGPVVVSHQAKESGSQDVISPYEMTKGVAVIDFARRGLWMSRLRTVSECSEYALLNLLQQFVRVGNGKVILQLPDGDRAVRRICGVDVVSRYSSLTGSRQAAQSVLFGIGRNMHDDPVIAFAGGGYLRLEGPPFGDSVIVEPKDQDEVVVKSGTQSGPWPWDTEVSGPPALYTKTRQNPKDSHSPFTVTATAK
jgi:hypothetical protein